MSNGIYYPFILPSKPYHKSAQKTLNKKDNSWLVVGMTVFHMDDKCDLNGKNDSWSCDYMWRDQEFKLTRFSFKLLEKIMQPVAAGKYRATSIYGFPLTKIIKDLEKKGIDFSDVLNPLAGL
jgi:hypothetical protein